MKRDLTKTIEQFVGLLMPELTLYEAAMYIFLLRNSHLKNLSEIRMGKRTIAEKWGTGARGKRTNYAHVTDLVKGLEKKGCLKIGDVNREGTLYKILLPEEIPLVKEKLLVQLIWRQLLQCQGKKRFWLGLTFGNPE